MRANNRTTTTNTTTNNNNNNNNVFNKVLLSVVWVFSCIFTDFPRICRGEI